MRKKNSEKSFEEGKTCLTTGTIHDSRYRNKYKPRLTMIMQNREDIEACEMTRPLPIVNVIFVVFDYTLSHVSIAFK